ncbi:MAG: ROK family protein [Lentisphaeria bacterium]|nr:ROK family protein [Lentisphaeria bacterium]
MRRREELDHKILSYMFRHGHAPRPELVAYTGIRAATVFESVDRLKESGLLIEPTRRGKKTGRKAPELECNPAFAHWVGLDLNTVNVTAVVTDNNGRILHEVIHSAGNRTNAEDVFAEVFAALTALQEKAGKDWFKVCGTGFSDPGPVDLRQGVSLNAVNIPGWQNVETVKRLERETALPCGLWTDEMVRAHQAYLARQQEAPERLLHICLGSTIGSGFVIDGKIYYGSHGKAMEIGHLVIDPAGPLCSCGSCGCLEAMLSLKNLSEHLQAQKQAGLSTALDPDRLTLSALLAASPDDEGVRELIRYIGSGVGKALIPVVTLLDPDLIVLSGELAQLRERLLHPIAEQLDKNCLQGAASKVKIEFSSQKENDTARGAALLMRDRVLLSQLV